MGSDLNYYLGILRPREVWLCIFKALLEENEEEMIVKPLITPKKRKHRYLMETTPSRLASMESWDPLESPDSFKDLSEKLQQVDQRLTNFQLRVGDNVDVLFNRVQEIKASIGSIPVSLLNDECTTVWEMLAIVRSLITDPELFQPVEIKLTDLLCSGLMVALQTDTASPAAKVPQQFQFAGMQSNKQFCHSLGNHDCRYGLERWRRKELLDRNLRKCTQKIGIF